MRTVTAVVLDTETTGLEVEEDFLLEIGMVAVDANMETIDTFESYVCNPEAMARLDVLEMLRMQYLDYPEHERAEAPKVLKDAAWVIDTHRNSGLLARLEDGFGGRPEVVAANAIDWLRTLGVEKEQIEVTGSNVANFDRRFLNAFMPELDKFFHYRNGDISSMKTLLRRWAPDMFAHAQDIMPPANGRHRCISDCLDSLAELRAYIDVIGGRGE